MSRIILFQLLVVSLLNYQKANGQDSIGVLYHHVDTPDWLSFTVYDSLLQSGHLEYRSMSLNIGTAACEIRVLREYDILWNPRLISGTGVGAASEFGLNSERFNQRLFNFLANKKGEGIVNEIKNRIENCSNCGCDHANKVTMENIASGQINFNSRRWKLSSNEEMAFSECIGKSQPLWDLYGVGVTLTAKYTNCGDSMLGTQRLDYLKGVMMQNGFDSLLIQTNLTKAEADTATGSSQVQLGIFYPNLEGYDPNVFEEE